MDTQSFVREEVRIAADEGDTEEAEKRGAKLFPKTENVTLASYQVKKVEKEDKKGSYMEVTAKINIRILFFSISPIEYSYTAQSPILN